MGNVIAFPIRPPTGIQVWTILEEGKPVYLVVYVEEDGRSWEQGRFETFKEAEEIVLNWDDP